MACTVETHHSSQLMFQTRDKYFSNVLTQTDFSASISDCVCLCTCVFASWTSSALSGQSLRRDQIKEVLAHT